MALGFYQVIALAFVSALALVILVKGTEMLTKPSTGPAFHVDTWHNPGRTVDVSDVLLSKYVRVQSHTVRLARGSMSEGWTWIDLYDQVDVLVEDEDGSFLVLRQEKYGIDGKSLAVVSALLQHKADPLQAAKIEVVKELGRMSIDWISLGKYRTDAVRGGGHVHVYLARKTKLVDQSQRLPSDDSEEQEVVKLTRSELTSALLSGDFKEAKWCATAALALLHVMNADAAKVNAA